MAQYKKQNDIGQPSNVRQVSSTFGGGVSNNLHKPSISSRATKQETIGSHYKSSQSQNQRTSIRNQTMSEKMIQTFFVQKAIQNQAKQQTNNTHEKMQDNRYSGLKVGNQQSINESMVHQLGKTQTTKNSNFRQSLNNSSFGASLGHQRSMMSTQGLSSQLMNQKRSPKFITMGKAAGIPKGPPPQYPSSKQLQAKTPSGSNFHLNHHQKQQIDNCDVEKIGNQVNNSNFQNHNQSTANPMYQHDPQSLINYNQNRQMMDPRQQQINENSMALNSDLQNQSIEGIDHPSANGPGQTDDIQNIQQRPERRPACTSYMQINQPSSSNAVNSVEQEHVNPNPPSKCISPIMTQGQRNSQMTFNDKNTANRNSAVNFDINNSMQQAAIQNNPINKHLSQKEFESQVPIDFTGAVTEDHKTPEQLVDDSKQSQFQTSYHQGNTRENQSMQVHAKDNGVVISQTEFELFQAWQRSCHGTTTSQEQIKIDRAMKNIQNLGLEVKPGVQQNLSDNNNRSMLNQTHQSFSSIPRRKSKKRSRKRRSSSKKQKGQIKTNYSSNMIDKSTLLKLKKFRKPTLKEFRGGSVPQRSNINQSDNGFTSMSQLTHGQNRSMDPSPISLEIKRQQKSPMRIDQRHTPHLASIQKPFTETISQVQMLNECSNNQSVRIQSEMDKQMLSDPHILSHAESSRKYLQPTLAELQRQPFPSMFSSGDQMMKMQTMDDHYQTMTNKPLNNKNANLGLYPSPTDKTNFKVSNRGGGVITLEEDSSHVLSAVPRQKKEQVTSKDTLPSQRLPELNHLNQHELFDHKVRAQFMNIKLNENSSVNTKSKVSLVQEPKNSQDLMIQYLQSMEQRFNQQVEMVHKRMDQFQTEFFGTINELLSKQTVSMRSSSKKTKKAKSKSTMSKTFRPIRYAALSFNTSNTLDKMMQQQSFPISPTETIEYKTMDLGKQLALLQDSIPMPMSPSNDANDCQVDQYLSRISQLSKFKGQEVKMKNKKNVKNTRNTVNDPACIQRREVTNEQMTQSQRLYAQLQAQIEEQKQKLAQLDQLKTSKRFSSIENKKELICHNDVGSNLTHQENEFDYDPNDDSIRAPPSATFHQKQQIQSKKEKIGQQNMKQNNPHRRESLGNDKHREYRTNQTRGGVSSGNDHTLNLTYNDISQDPNLPVVSEDEMEQQDLLKQLQFSKQQNENNATNTSNSTVKKNIKDMHLKSEDKYNNTFVNNGRLFDAVSYVTNVTGGTGKIDNLHGKDLPLQIPKNKSSTKRSQQVIDLSLRNKFQQTKRVEQATYQKSSNRETLNKNTSQQSHIDSALLDLHNQKNALLEQYQLINSQTMMLQQQKGMITSSQDKLNDSILDHEMSFNKAYPKEEEKASQNHMSCAKLESRSQQQIDSKQQKKRQGNAPKLTESLCQTISSGSRESLYNKGETAENDKRLSALPDLPPNGSTRLKKAIDFNQDQYNSVIIQPGKGNNQELTSPPTKGMVSITQKFGQSQIIDEDQLQAELQLFNESETNPSDAGAAYFNHNNKFQEQYFLAQNQQNIPSQTPDQLEIVEANQFYYPFQQSSMKQMDPHQKRSYDNIAQHIPSHLRQDDFEVKIREDISSPSQQVLSPTVIYEKQEEIMQELKRMRQRSNEHTGMAILSSSDKLSYSQTINLNNLKSIENMPSPDNIVDLVHQYPGYLDEDDEPMGLKDNYLNDFDNLKDLTQM